MAYARAHRAERAAAGSAGHPPASRPSTARDAALASPTIFAGGGEVGGEIATLRRLQDGFEREVRVDVGRNRLSVPAGALHLGAESDDEDSALDAVVRLEGSAGSCAGARGPEDPVGEGDEAGGAGPRPGARCVLRGATKLA